MSCAMRAAGLSFDWQRSRRAINPRVVSMIYLDLRRQRTAGEQDGTEPFAAMRRDLDACRKAKDSGSRALFGQPRRYRDSQTGIAAHPSRRPLRGPFRMRFYLL